MKTIVFSGLRNVAAISVGLLLLLAAWLLPLPIRSDTLPAATMYLPPINVPLAPHLQRHALKIMALGDSITYGAREDQNINRVWIDCGGGYRPILWSALEAEGVNVDPVGSVNLGFGAYDWHCEAHPGGTTRDFARNYAVWDRDIHPDIILCQLGTNDPGNGMNVNETMKYSASLWQQIFAADPHVLLFVATVLPSRGGPNHHRFGAINEGLRHQVIAWQLRGYNIRLVDMDRECAFTDSDFGTEVGLHPNQTGYRKMASVWLKVLNSTLQSGTHITYDHGIASLQSRRSSDRDHSN